MVLDWDKVHETVHETIEAMDGDEFVELYNKYCCEEGDSNRIRLMEEFEDYVRYEPILSVIDATRASFDTSDEYFIDDCGDYVSFDGDSAMDYVDLDELIDAIVADPEAYEGYMDFEGLEEDEDEDE